MTRDRSEEHQHTHPRGHGEHGHTHGAVDPTIATSERGIWAIKWSFVGLMATAVPLGIAFALTHLGVSRCFTFGYGRVEDLAGVVIVLIILFSAVVAGY